jgi:hypothetical protein
LSKDERQFCFQDALFFETQISYHIWAYGNSDKKIFEMDGTFSCSDRAKRFCAGGRFTALGG